MLIISPLSLGATRVDNRVFGRGSRREFGAAGAGRAPSSRVGAAHDPHLPPEQPGALAHPDHARNRCPPFRVGLRTVRTQRRRRARRGDAARLDPQVIVTQSPTA
jgi:hypothetical protein